MRVMSGDYPFTIEPKLVYDSKEINEKRTLQ